MEKCALTIRLPSLNAVLPHEYEVNDIRGRVRLDICELDAVRPLNPLDLTWKKHPKCIKHARTIDATVGDEVELEPFPCRTGTFRAFEVSCAPEMPECGVNVWSNHNDTWGMYFLFHFVIILTILHRFVSHAVSDCVTRPTFYTPYIYCQPRHKFENMFLPRESTRTLQFIMLLT
jgi:hypothetical protein